jgi:kumamolisin
MSTLSQPITISIYLKRDKHDNGMSLKEYADAIAAGTHPILSHDEFAYQFGSVQDEMDLVIEWASRNGLTVVSSSLAAATVKVSGTAEQFDSLFGITLKTAKTDDGYDYQTYDGTVVIPTDIDDVVQKILGFNTKPIFKNRAIKFTGASTGVATPRAYPTKVPVTPIEVANAYNVPAGDGYGGCVGLIELTSVSYATGYNTADVTSSFTRIGLTPPTVIDVLVNGAKRNTTSDSETMLDIYCAGGVVPKANIVVYTAPNTGQGFYDAIMATSTDTTNMPSTLGISWGADEDVNDGDYLTDAFQACVAVGITCFASAGDLGANNLVPDYPATNAYQIASGGTALYLKANGSWDNETAWTTNGAGGGGISGVVALPSWQTDLTYTTITASGTGDPTPLAFRGYPDISAPADPSTGYEFYLNDTLVQYGGTSAAAPFLAGMLCRLTQLWGRRTSFANTLFYANTQAFTDITVGNNRAGFATGYTTTAGWDACTGLGSPKGDEIYKLFHTGSTYPKLNYGFRPTTGAVYPRKATGAIYGSTPFVQSTSFAGGSGHGTFYGNIINNGGYTITDMGIVYSDTNNNPTIADTKVSVTPIQSGSFNNTFSIYSNVYARAYATNIAGTVYGASLYSTGWYICLVKGTLIHLADGSTKSIESITYSDLLAIWNFDSGILDSAKPLWIKKVQTSNQYNLIKFSDGSHLKTIVHHRIFNKESGSFTSTMDISTPIGTTTYTISGQEVTVVSKEVIEEEVEFYNIITNRHINLFANGILTSCRYNNIYPIVKMKFIKDPIPRPHIDKSAYETVPEIYYDGLRLSEQTIPVQDSIKYIERLEILKL